LIVNDTTPDDTLDQFKDRWVQNSQFPDLLEDTAFGSIDMMNQLKFDNVRVCSLCFLIQSLIFGKSCLQVKQQFNLIEYLLIYNLLLGLIPNTWKGAINNNRIIASVYIHKNESSNKVTCH
jgi:hypothetical protein